MSFSDYLELKILELITGKTVYTAGDTLPQTWVGLSTADPLDTGSGLAEPVGGAYARVATTATDWATAAAGSISNATILTFAAATASWGTITHFAIFDALTAGNLLGSGILTVSKTVGNGDTVSFAVGQLTITLN